MKIIYKENFEKPYLRLIDEVGLKGRRLGFPLQGEVLLRLRHVADDGEEGVLVQVVALEGRDGVGLEAINPF